jgi:hypothetical protein
MCFDRNFNTNNKMFHKYASFSEIGFFMFMPDYCTKKLNDNRGFKCYWDRVNSVVIASNRDLIKKTETFLSTIIYNIIKIDRDPYIVAEKMVLLIKDFISNN